MKLCDVVCIGLMGYGLGLFTAFFLYGWLEERSDRYDRAVWSKKLNTCIDWTLRRAQRESSRSSLSRDSSPQK